MMALRISAARTQKQPLTLDMNRSRFGTVSGGTNQQALTSLSWLSYSRSVMNRSPGRSRPGRTRRRAASSPRWQSWTDLTGLSPELRDASSRYGPNPFDGICTHFDERDPAERKNASLDKACLRRPVNYAIG